MALTNSYEDKTGITSTNAYAMITRLQGNYFAKNASIRVEVFHDQTARENNKERIAVFNYNVRNIQQRLNPDGSIEVEEDLQFDDYFGPSVLDTEGKNPVNQAYEYIKAKQGWDTWTDC